MAVNHDPVYAGVAFGNMVSIAATGSDTEIDLVAVDATYDRRIDILTIATDDTAVKLFELYLNDGTDDKIITNIPTAITAGMTALGATAPCNILGHANMVGSVQSDTAGNKFFILPRGCTLRGKFNAALTAGKLAYVQVRGWKFADA
jgi:hypothetical protein